MEEQVAKSCGENSSTSILFGTEAMTLPTQYAIPNTRSAHQVQSYLHVKARAGREALIVGGFTLYLHMGEPASGVSLVLPIRPNAPLTAPILERIEHIFAKRGHVVCFQLLDSFAPAMIQTLESAGYGVQATEPVLVCEPGEVLRLQNDKLDFVTISADSPLEDVAENWNINARGFDPNATLAQPADVAEFRRSLKKSRAFTARLDNVGVSAGMYTDIHDGVTELVGIATLEEYRRRGFGGALTAFATSTTFDDGASLVFLVAASEEAGRVYQRVGFRPVGNLVLLTKKLKDQRGTQS